MEQLFDKIFLPKVKEEILEEVKFVDLLVEIRIIRPLEGFGLLEVIRKKEGYFSKVVKVRKSELFDRFVRWEV